MIDVQSRAEKTIDAGNNVARSAFKGVCDMGVYKDSCVREEQTRVVTGELASLRGTVREEGVNQSGSSVGCGLI